MNSFEDQFDRHSSRDRASQSVSRDGSYRGGVAGATTLIVDDVQRNRFALTALLERHGMTVVEAGSGALAVETLHQRADIDIVLVDIMMPVMDGYQTMAAIRRRRACSAVPIIAMTAKDGYGERDRCLAAGGSDYIPKPIDPDRLMTLISHWVPAFVAAA
jgi:CheY-like chemotaxis protein